MNQLDGCWLAPKGVHLDWNVADKDDILRRLLASLAGRAGLTEDESAQVLDGILEREQKGSTVFPPGVAVPHVKCGVVDSVWVEAARLAVPLTLPNAYGGHSKVRLFFLIVGHPSCHQQIMALNSRLLQACQDAALQQQLLSVETPQEFCDLLAPRLVGGAP